MNHPSIILCLIGLSYSGLEAAVMLQQENVAGSAYHFSAAGYGQSFKTDMGFIASGIELSMKASPFGAFKTTVSIYNYDAATQTFAGLTPLAVGVIDSEQISTTQSWIMAQFSTPVALQPGKEYAFRVTDGMQSSNQFYFSPGDAYNDGAWLNISSGGAFTTMDIDSSFKIHAVPEPSLYFMLSICGASCVVRRKR